MGHPRAYESGGPKSLAGNLYFKSHPPFADNFRRRIRPGQLLAVGILFFHLLVRAISYSSENQLKLPIVL